MNLPEHLLEDKFDDTAGCGYLPTKCYPYCPRCAVDKILAHVKKITYPLYIDEYKRVTGEVVPKQIVAYGMLESDYNELFKK